jgi:hypothetical protein
MQWKQQSTREVNHQEQPMWQNFEKVTMQMYATEKQKTEACEAKIGASGTLSSILSQIEQKYDHDEPGTICPSKICNYILWNGHTRKANQYLSSLGNVEPLLMEYCISLPKLVHNLHKQSLKLGFLND